MKQNKEIKPIFYSKRAILALLISGSFLACLAVAPLTYMQSPDIKSAKTKPTPPKDELDEETVDELIGELKKSLESEIEDEDSVSEIVEKWESHKLTGKTREEVLEILFADVESVVDDEEITQKLWEDWTSDNSDAIEGAVTAPARDVSRFNSIKKSPINKTGKTFDKTFSTNAGQLKFWYEGSGGVAEFKPNSKVGNALVAWIQVVRTGGKDRWYASEADIKAFSDNNSNFLLRTDAVYGFRVDRTKGENTPFYEQTNLKSADTLTSYALAFDFMGTSAKSGGYMKFSDSPKPQTGLKRMEAVDPKNDEYRFYFLLSPMNTETGEIYGTVEWGLVLRKKGPNDVVFEVLEPSLVTTAIPELKGRDLAFDRWNTIFSRQYTSVDPKLGKIVYPIPGQKKYWGK